MADSNPTRLEQAWLNLRVWAPALSNPELRSREVRYLSRESRTGLKWSVPLPKQCCRCGTAEGIRSQDFQRDLRAFESPLSIIAGAGGFALLLLLAAIAWGWLWLGLIAMILAAVGAGLLWIKSWQEEVRLSMWGCDGHFSQMACPGLVLHDDELHVYVPSAELAQVARADLLAARRRLQRYPDAVASGVPGRAASRRETEESPAESPRADSLPFVPAPRPELPPIKLDD